MSSEETLWHTLTRRCLGTTGGKGASAKGDGTVASGDDRQEEMLLAQRLLLDQGHFHLKTSFFPLLQIITRSYFSKQPLKKILHYDIKNVCIYTYMHTFQFLKNYLAFFSCWGILRNQAGNEQLCGSLKDRRPCDTEADPLHLSPLLTMHFLRLCSARSSVSGRRKSCTMDVSIVGNITHTLTHSQIRKQKTNHLLIGRKVLAAADETNGSREERGEEKTLVS